MRLRPLVWFGLVTGLAGPILAVGAWLDGDRYARLDELGITVPATIGMYEESRSWRGRSSYVLGVEYEQADGRQRRRKLRVTEAFAGTVVQGASLVQSTCQVRYLPSDPDVAVVVGGSEDPRQLLWPGIGLGVVGGGLLVVAWLRRVRLAPAG